MHHPWQKARSAGLVFLFLVLLPLAACSRPSDPSPAGSPATAVETPEPPGTAPATPVPPPADSTGGADEPQAAPDLVETRQEVIDQQRALLREGRIERHIPRQMRQGVVHTVRVRVGQGDAPPLEGPPAEIDVDQVLVGSDLVAELSGPDFEISRVGGDDGRRLLTSDGYTEWLWNVRPTSSGNLSLQVVLFVRLRDGSEPPLEVRTFSEEVTVSVTPWQVMGSFFTNYGAATGLTIPVIVGAVIAIVRFTRARRTAPSRSHRLGD